MSPTGLIPRFSKAEGNTYSTLLHHPFLFKEKTNTRRRKEEVAPPFLFSLEKGKERGASPPPFPSIGLASLVEGPTIPLWAGMSLPRPIKPI